MGGPVRGGGRVESQNKRAGTGNRTRAQSLPLDTEKVGGSQVEGAAPGSPVGPGAAAALLFAGDCREPLTVSPPTGHSLVLMCLLHRRGAGGGVCAAL